MSWAVVTIEAVGFQGRPLLFIRNNGATYEDNARFPAAKTLNELSPKPVAKQ